MLSPLASYATVLALPFLSGAQPFDSVHSALASPSVWQPLLLGLAVAPPALRGECSPMHNREVWDLISFLGVSLHFLVQQAPDAARRVLRSSACPGGPLLMELVRDVAVAVPRSPPPGIPRDSFLVTLASVCRAIALPLAGANGGTDSAAPAAPLTAADWAAVEAYAVLAPAIRLAASPPSQLSRELLQEVAGTAYDALRAVLQVLQGAAIPCTPKQLQLLFDVAWEAASMLPLHLAAMAANPVRAPAGIPGALGRVSLTLIQTFLSSASALWQPAASPAFVAAGSRPAGSAEDAGAAAAVSARLLQQAHIRLCKMVHFVAAAPPAEQRLLQAALAEAQQRLAGLLAQCFDELHLALEATKRSGIQPAEEGPAAAGEEHAM